MGSPYNNKPSLTQAEAEQAETQTISGKIQFYDHCQEPCHGHRINRYNPSFDNMLSANGQYDLTLPSDKMQLFLANKYQILMNVFRCCWETTTFQIAEPVYPQKKKS